MKTGEMISMRKAYGEALLELGKKNPRVVALSAEVLNSDFSYMFGEAFPDRFFNVGIAEQALVDVSVGFALGGYIPFANTFAVFFATRAIEMVRTHLCYGRNNVKLMGAYAGLSDSFDGPTHHSITDLAIFRSLPGMTVLVPSDAVAVAGMIDLAAEIDGPVYVRLSRNEVETIRDKPTTFRAGGSELLRKGKDVTIFVTGVPTARALAAADQLAGKGISARVVDLYSVKPLDREAILAAAEETGAIVTVEEHSVVGGMGSAVCEVLAGTCPVPVLMTGVQDRFAETGPYDKLLDTYGLAVSDIVANAIAAIELASKRKSGQKVS